MSKKKIITGLLASLFLMTGFGLGEVSAMEKTDKRMDKNKKPQKIVQTAGRDNLGKIAPKFAELNDDILFGEVWSRQDKLSLRDRSVVTVVSLVTKGIFDNSFKYHMQNAKNNGVTSVEMAEILTHQAFYVGWPNAWAAFGVMKEVYGENQSNAIDRTMSKEEFAKVNVFGLGEPNNAYAKYFIGQSYLNRLTQNGDALPIYNVTFETGCRNNWHTHKAKSGGGQVLIVTAGEGWYQKEGEEPVLLTPGMVVTIPANVKHWHGATKDSYFSHIAFEIPGEETSNEWFEEVHNDLYEN